MGTPEAVAAVPAAVVAVAARLVSSGGMGRGAAGRGRSQGADPGSAISAGAQTGEGELVEAAVARAGLVVVDHAACPVLLAWPDEAPSVATVPPPPQA